MRLSLYDLMALKHFTIGSCFQHRYTQPQQHATGRKLEIQEPVCSGLGVLLHLGSYVILEVFLNL